MFFKKLSRSVPTYKKPNANDPHRPFVSLPGAILTALIFVGVIIGLLYVFDETNFRSKNRDYIQTAPRTSEWYEF